MSKLIYGPSDTTWERPSSRDFAVCRVRPCTKKPSQIQSAVFSLLLNHRDHDDLSYLEGNVSYLIGEENINREEKQSHTNNCSSCSFTQTLQKSRVGLCRHSLVLVWKLDKHKKNLNKHDINNWATEPSFGFSLVIFYIQSFSNDMTITRHNQ